MTKVDTFVFFYIQFLTIIETKVRGGYMYMSQFLPVNRKEMEERGWQEVDFVYICGDAYVDHPSFGAAIICRT